MENRVQFRYPVRKTNGTEFEEIPFVIAVIADLSGSRQLDPKTQSARFVEVKPRGTDPLMTRIAPVLQKWSLEFRSLDDFSPDRLLAHLMMTAEVTNQGTATLGSRLDNLLHDPAFERLHATWLGLDRVAQACSDVPAAKIAVLDIPEANLFC